jgi:hypothetical protein
MPISTINSNSIGNGTVIAADILDGTISSSKLVSANIAGDRIAANTLSNTVFQTGSVESYMRGANLDFGMRNRIINGAMQIDQRNAGAAVTPTNTQYTLDRYWAWLSQTAKLTVQQDSSANTVAGFTSSLKVTSSSSYSVTSSDYFAVVQTIEGFNIADLAWGTASAKPVTLSFWVRSSLTGTFGGSLMNSAQNYSYPFSYTIAAANTWEQKIITIVGPTAGTWVVNNGKGIQVNFGLGVGSENSGTAGAWTGTGIISTTGAVSVVGTNAATWYITGVQLEEGSQATSFEYRHYGTELQLCQRYYWKNFPAQSGVNITLGICATNQLRSTVWYPTIMRSAPTFSMSGLVGDDEQSSVYTLSISSAGSGTQTARVTFTATGAVGGRPAVVQTNSNTSFLDASAEL